MGVATNFKEEIINLAKELPKDKLTELIDFAYFLKAKDSAICRRRTALNM